MRRTSFVIALAAGLLAAPARGADVHIGINIGVPPPPPPAVVEAPPPPVVVPQTPVYFAPSLPYNYFYYGGAPLNPHPLPYVLPPRLSLPPALPPLPPPLPPVRPPPALPPP